MSVSSDKKVNNAIVRHHEFYFSDGSVVLVLENTALRLHQSVLGRHSEFFSGMWDMPQPSTAETYDGCPAVFLPDPLDDFVDIIKVFYDPFHFDQIGPDMSLRELISFISGILRMSTKYHVQQVRQKCITIIQDKFPSTLAGCDDVLKRKLQYRLFEIDRIIPLAREANVPRVLPWAFYLCSQMSVNDLLQNSVLEWEDKALCLAGKEHLWEMRKTVTHTFLFSFYPSPLCTNSCKLRMPDSFHTALETIEYLRRTPHVLEEYTEWSTLRLCGRCQTHVRAQHMEGRERVWHLLPSFFNLGTWDDIFKDQG